MKKVFSFLISLVALGLMTIPSGCSDKSENGAASNSAKVAEGPPATPQKTLLDLVPPNAVAVSDLDTTSPGYAKWKQSPYGALTAKLQGFSLEATKSPSADPSAPSPSDEVKGLTALMSGIKQTGLVAFDPAQKDSAKEIVYFMTVGAPAAPNSPPSLGMAYYFSALPGTNFKEKLTQLAAHLSTQGFAPTKSTANGLELFNVKLLVPGSEAAAIPGMLGLDTLYAAADESKLALASSEALAKKLFDTTETPGLAASEAFKAAAEYLPANRSDAVGIGYFDLKLVAAAFASAAPPEEREKVKSTIASMPFESVVGSLMVEDHAIMRYAIPYAPKNEEQKKWFSTLQGAKSPAVLKNGPADSILFIALDGTTLQSIKDTAVSQAGPGEQEMMKQQLAPLDALRSLGIGVANATGASPFPEVFLLADADKATEVLSNLKMLAGGLAATSGMPASPWQQKQIEGVNVDFMLSPFGVGLYLGTSGNSVFIASSETMAAALVSTIAGKTPSVASASKEFADGAALAVHLNFGKLYGLLESVQGSLGMFTGGQSNFDPAQFAVLKELGSSSALINADAKALRITTHFRPEVAKPQ